MGRALAVIRDNLQLICLEGVRRIRVQGGWGRKGKSRAEEEVAGG